MLTLQKTMLKPVILLWNVGSVSECLFLLWSVWLRPLSFYPLVIWHPRFASWRKAQHTVNMEVSKQTGTELTDSPQKPEWAAVSILTTSCQYSTFKLFLNHFNLLFQKECIYQCVSLWNEKTYFKSICLSLLCLNQHFIFHVVEWLNETLTLNVVTKFHPMHYTDPSESHKCELYYINIIIGYLLYFGNH